MHQPEELAELNEAYLHGLHSDEYFEDDASSTSSNNSRCERFYVNLRLEVNERLLSSSDDDDSSCSSSPMWKRRSRLRKKKKKGTCEGYFSIKYLT